MFPLEGVASNPKKLWLDLIAEEIFQIIDKYLNSEGNY